MEIPKVDQLTYLVFRQVETMLSSLHGLQSPRWQKGLGQEGGLLVDSRKTAGPLQQFT